MFVEMSFCCFEQDEVTKVFEKGKLIKEEINFRCSKNKIVKTYFENGALSSMSELQKDGTGQVTEYYPSGKVMRFAPLVKGLKEGKALSYDNIGKLEAIENFKNDKQEGYTVCLNKISRDTFSEAYIVRDSFIFVKLHDKKDQCKVTFRACLKI